MADAEQRLREMLKKIAKEKDYVNCDVEVEPVNSGGANYTSRLFAVTLCAPAKPDLKLFAKVAVIGERIRSMSSTPMFEIETIFYTKILPKYRELEERYNVPKNQRLVFSKYHGGTTEYLKEMLVLDDLTFQGYRSYDRLKCYDWEYAADCISMLARLHALSVAYERDGPEEYAKLTDILKFDFPVEHLKDFFGKCIETGIKATEVKYKERVKKFLRGHLQSRKFLKYYTPERKVFLRHGDFRPSNILQKRDEYGRLQLVLVDHQMVQCGNPVTDLLFFLICGSDEEFRANHLQQFFDHYYEEFRKALERLRIDANEVYKKEDYDEDVQELLPYGLTLAAFTLPIITVDASKAANPEDGFDVENMDMEVSDLFPIRFNGLVRDFVRLGIL